MCHHDSYDSATGILYTPHYPEYHNVEWCQCNFTSETSTTVNLDILFRLQNVDEGSQGLQMIVDGESPIYPQDDTIGNTRMQSLRITPGTKRTLLLDNMNAVYHQVYIAYNGMYTFVLLCS